MERSDAYPFGENLLLCVHLGYARESVCCMNFFERTLVSNVTTDNFLCWCVVLQARPNAIMLLVVATHSVAQTNHLETVMRVFNAVLFAVLQVLLVFVRRFDAHNFFVLGPARAYGRLPVLLL